MGLSVNILTSGFLVTVIVFFVIMGVFLYYASTKVGEVITRGNSKTNNLDQLDTVYKYLRTSYILAFIAAAMTLLLAILYGGHELVFTLSEYWHAAIYFLTYILLIISFVYAILALNKLYTLEISDRNGADAYIWASMLMTLFAFIGLTATGSGRLGMNAVRSGISSRINKAEANVNEHLPQVRNKIDQLHAQTFGVPVYESQGVQTMQVSQPVQQMQAPVMAQQAMPPMQQQAAQPMMSPMQQATSQPMTTTEYIQIPSMSN